MAKRPHAKATLPAVAVAVAVAVAALLAQGAAFGQTTTDGAAPPFRLDLPVACAMDRDCFVQQYVDQADGPDYADYRCGALSNDGHRGTDIRTRTIVEMERGIPVVAAADGVVRRTREGVPDVHVELVGRAAVDDIGLGNAVIVAHGDGWETVYGHLRRGSVAVRSGDRVTRGQPLGQIGLSGLTEFPHVHFEVLHHGQPIDPFVGRPASSGCTANPAGSGGSALWTPTAMARLGYRPTFLLHAGFAPAALNRAAMQYGLHDRGRLPATIESLYFAAFVAGVKAGDRYRFVIRDPAGAVLVDDVRTLDEKAAVKQLFAGVTKRDRPWPAGSYSGLFVLTRRDGDGPEDAVLEVRRTVELR